MNSNSGSLPSIHSVSAPLSVKNRTKEKFDALLQSAVQKKRHRKRDITVSKEKLLDDLESTTVSSENLSDNNKFDKISKVDQLDENTTSENYILNKFLLQQSVQKYDSNDVSSVDNDKNSSFSVNPPIPKPRKKKKLSQGTFEVTSPKAVKKSGSNNEGSVASNKTYDVEEVGDILVDKSPLIPKIIKRTKIRKSGEESAALESKVEEKNNENDKEESDDEERTQEISKTEKVQDDAIEYVDESTISKEKSQEQSDDLTPKKKYKYEKLVEIKIHKTDRLQLSSVVVHPLVKIHIVDATNGKYFPKSDKSRSVVFFYENADNNYISPVMTHACNLQEKRILYPFWEETILLNEDFEYFKDEGTNIILFFEILDFVSFAVLQQSNDKTCTSGWCSIAFAFLKVCGKNATLNIGNKVRLQLYYSYQSKKYNLQTCNPWIWWRKKKLKKYPSTLYVTISSVISPTTVIETFRSKTPVQKETSSKTKLCDDGQKISIVDSEPLILDNGVENTKSEVETINWTRRPGEPCRLPNKDLAKFKSYETGCFVMKFSHDGIYLACAVEIENLFYLLSLQKVNKFCCHQTLIYDIKWSNDDSVLLSASADNTVFVFYMSSSFFQVLPHPSYAYCCDISKKRTIASGCYDGIVRIWNEIENSTKSEFRLFQELEEHSGFVTSLCFSKQCSLFSADSIGIIIEWQQETSDWKLKRKIILLDIKETIINQILLFSKEKKLLVHSRDSVIRVVDVKTGCVLQWLRGGYNNKLQIFSTISPCGTFVYSGSENGFVHVWNSKNGSEMATYSPFSSDQFKPIHCVDFHPHDNILALSHYGKNLPILLYCFDKNLQQPLVDVEVKGELQSENQPISKPTIQLKEIARKSFRTKDEKLDFKGVLHKMDLVIKSQKNE